MTIRIRYTALTYLSNLEFALRAMAIRQALETHADVFSAPPIPMPILAEAVKNLKDITMLAASGAGSHNDKNERQNQRDAVTNMLMATGGYVLIIANAKSTYSEKKAIVELAGFTVQKKRESITLGEVNNVRAQMTGNAGEVLIIYNTVPGVKNFLIQTATSDPSSDKVAWRDAKITTRKKVVLEGLPSMSKIWCRVIALGKNSERSAPSDPTMCIVL